MTKQAEELLIIGNGFDLYSMLQSTYKDFFESRYSSECVEECNEYGYSLRYNELTELNKISDLNFWDLYFILNFLDDNNKDKTWANIEEEIRIFLTEDNKKLITKQGLINRSQQRIPLDLSPNRLIPMTEKLIRLLEARGKRLRATNIDEFLFSELLIFEKVFGEYINNESKNSENYQENSISTINNLVTDPKNTYVLSFNYTEVDHEKVSHVEYVHGKSTKDIIFGIDTVGLDAGTDEYRYSKTYRKLLMNVENQKHESLPKEVDKIVFFGHSLSLADFSYFQSIFDFYSIYDSTIELKFVFSVYEETKRSEIINNQLKSVTSLFSVYGKKMMNSHQGQNMLHKLILENRIKVVEIENS